MEAVLRDPARRRFVLYALALAFQLALAPFFVHDWDGFVFERSADDLLEGVTPYEVAEAPPFHVFLDDHWPPVNTWYAYPPLPLLVFTPLYAVAKVVSGEPTVHRLALKVPFILGNLALAYVAGHLVRHLASGEGEAREEKRRRAERWILFNPFLVFIAAVWGMFDAMMMAFLVASVLLLERGRPAVGGLAFAAAALCKLFPLFVSPLVAYYAWKRFSLRVSGRFVAAAVAAYSAVCLPFFLLAPRGFMEQWFLMHGARSPQGFALVSAPLQLAYLNQAFGWAIPIVPEAVVIAVSTALLALVLVLVHALAPRAKDPMTLVHVMLVTFVGALLVNKVVNEQYLVMPVALLSILAAASVGAAARRYRRALVAFTAGGLVSSILLGFHFITFIPADVAARTVHVRPDDVVYGLAALTGVPIFVVFSVPHLLSVLSLVPALAAGVTIVGPAFALAVQDARSALTKALRPTLSLRASRRAAATVVIAVLLLPPMASALLAVPPAPEDAPPLPEGTVVAFRYDLAIRNPAYSLDVRDGYWRAPGVPRPADGYYTANVAKVRSDFEAMAAMGASVVVVPFDAGNTLRLQTVLAAAESAGLRAAPSLDAAALADCPDAQFLPLRHLPAPGELPRDARMAALAARCASSALADFQGHPYAYRIDGRPVLLVLNSTTVSGDSGWLGSAVRTAVPDAYLVAGHDLDRPSPTWADASYAQPPQRGVPTEALAAFEEASRREVGGTSVRVVAVFPSTASVPPVVEDVPTFGRTWTFAEGADLVLAPWNLYREGSHVEPAADGAWVEDAEAGIRRLTGR